MCYLYSCVSRIDSRTFAVYRLINDLPKISTFFSARLYADDPSSQLLEVILTVYCVKLIITYQLFMTGYVVIS